MNKTPSLLALLALLLAPALVWAGGDHGGHGDHDQGGMHEHMAGMHQAAPRLSTAGRSGDPAKVSRTIEITMDDNMRFTPDRIAVKAGETVRFFVKNGGKQPHEMILGTPDELKQHAAMMRQMPGMKHAEPNMVSLAAGKRGGLVWQFDQAGTVDFACLIPGHMEAGMKGTIQVE